MRFRTWPVLAFALGGLLLLVVVALLATRTRTQEIFAQLDAVNVQHRKVDVTLRRLRSDVHLSNILVRDYLLDPSQTAGTEYRQRLAGLRAATTANLAELEHLVGRRETARIEGLRERIADYWETFDPLFDWTPSEKVARSLTFLRREVLPRRDAVLAIAQEIEAFNDANMGDQRGQVARRERELQAYLNRVLWASLGLGALVAVGAVVRIRVLETRFREQHERTEEAERELRGLSNRLVGAQEDERRRLARELHDEVGQMLTALRMEVGKAERLRTAREGFAASIAESKHIIETMMQTVRDLSMGLRPAMLDDFGLGSALDWHVRDFSRRYDVPVFLTVEGELDGLPEPHRTCVYRVVQEALTNCAKHSRARRVDVTLRESARQLLLTIEDDGVGLAPEGARRGGVGLLGIEERVREVGGALSIRSGAAGTTLEIRIPVPAQDGGMHESVAG
ncbi:MAG TPA: histidine kinase [Vicinamibacteria bacterium]|jgi:signal transduction histidine kinase